MNETSLTLFIQGGKALGVLNENFTNPVKRHGASIMVEPAKGVDYGAIGMAYDYWLRCVVQPARKDLLESFIGYSVFLERYPKHAKAKKAWSKYAAVFSKPRDSDSQGTADLFAACLFLAKFENEYRCSLPVETFEVNQENVNELGRIANATDLARFKRQRLVTNPDFSLQGSKLLINGDGDLIVEETLIDLKTASSIELKGNIRQLIGYWALNELSPKPHKIERLGVYYPRFNYYVDFAPADLMTAEQQTVIKKLFSDSLGKGIKIPKW